MVAESDRSRREPHWVTPRLALLRDGRLAVTCDLDDYEHSHEYQEPGIYVWWSTDLGQTWSAPENTGILGIEPDRIIELPDGRLSMGSHFLPAETQKHAEYIWRSADGGRTWGPGVAVARDAVHMYCEGAYIPLAGGALLCVLRDNLHHNYPSQVALSFDNGETWTVPVEAPFAGDRPFIGQLEDGRILVTFRNQGGNRGTYAWLGTVDELISTGYRVSALHLGPEEIQLSAGEGLRITHRRPATTKYNLLPPESYRSEVLFDVQVPRREPQWRPGRALRPGAAGPRQRAPHARAERALPERLRFPAPPDRPPLPGGPDPLAPAGGCTTPPGWCGCTWTARTCCASACRPPVPSSPPASAVRGRHGDVLLADGQLPHPQPIGAGALLGLGRPQRAVPGPVRA